MNYLAKNKPLSFCLFLVFLISMHPLSGQENPYYFTSQIDSLLVRDSTAYKYQTASWNLSFIGEYSKALEYKDKQFPHAKPSAASPEQVRTFSMYKARQAHEIILREAAKTRIVIINEAHHIGLHRVFMSSLLKDLYRLGYTYIGMEGLNYSDTLLNVRGYPLGSSGFYTREPCYARLIRESIQHGLTVFPYEQVYTDKFQVEAGREKAEALNIKKIMDQNPQAKFIIYCGYDHAVEDSLRNFMGLPMAGQLKRLTGINPFTIDQTALSEYFMVGSRYRQLMTQDFDAIYVDSIGRYFNMANSNKVIDCHVFHPNTRYIKGRPAWLKKKNTRLLYLSSKINITYPCLVKIYLATDNPTTAVPIDVIELHQASDRKASLLYKRQKHVAIISNPSGHTQIIYLR